MTAPIRLVALALVLAPSLTARAAPPKVWAIAIGIDDYDDKLIPGCHGAARDARAVAAWFERTAGWGERNVLRMDELGRKAPGRPGDPITNLRPTRANLDWAVVEWLGHRVGPGDVCVIYFAGQATSKPPVAGSTVGRSYLLPIDARGGDVEATGWSLEGALDRARWVADGRAKAVVWLDTSPIGRGSAGLPVVAGHATGRDWLGTLTRWPGLMAWLADDDRIAPDDGSFVGLVAKALGTSDRAHNLLGTLQGVRDDPTMAGRGFQAMGGVGAGVSLWSGGALVVEDAKPELIVQSGHGDRVTSVLVTADDSRMITASRDSTVRVWDLADRSLLRVLTDPIVGVEALALDRDGAVLVAGDGVGRLVGWDLTLDRPRPAFGPPGHDRGVVDLAFVGGSKSFVSRDRGRHAILWDASGGSIRKVCDLEGGLIGRVATASRPVKGVPGLVAAVEIPGGGALLAFDAEGHRLARWDGPGGRITALDLSAGGRRVVAGDDAGRVLVLDSTGGAEVSRHQFRGPVRLARFARSGWLVVSDDDSLRMVEERPDGLNVALADPSGAPVPGEVDRVAISGDGRWLAACTSIEGRALLWRLGDGPKAVAVALPGEAASGLSPAFSPDGRSLLVGDASGAIRAWTLEDREGRPFAQPRPTIAESRGRVVALAPSMTGQYLLEITRRDGLALVWDLGDGRTCKPLPGSWVAGAFLPDESKLVLCRAAEQGGDVVLVDRATRLPLPTRFERPSGADGQPSTASFGRVAVSKSGRWVAASALESQRPLACVWRVEDGRLAHIARGHDEGLTGVEFSGDEAFLLTSSLDGTARFWPMAEPALEWSREAVAFRNPDLAARGITVARACPGLPGRVATGTRGGDLFLWDWSGGNRPRRVDLAREEGEVTAAAFTPDGRWLAAAWSLGKSILFWSIPEAGEPKLVAFRPRPHHDERVGALTAWPDGSMFVSGGDDSAIKFWKLEGRSLVGTLMAQGRIAGPPDWLAFSPEGLYDGSAAGESMVKWRVGERVVTLEQSADARHWFGLAASLAKGNAPVAPGLAEDGPRLRFAGPSGDVVSAVRETELTVWSGDADPSALRLYQDGVPVRGEGDFRPGPDPHLRTTRVALRPGSNRFYAMASKPGAVDGRSDDLTLRYDGPEAPGRVHVVALGVGNYPKRPLKYTQVDARRVAEILHSKGIEPGRLADEPIVLLDADVTPESIDRAFRGLREAVKGRPEDTVVMFLAGHTDTDVQSGQLCLLLPSFPFEPEAPTPSDLLGTGELRVAARGATRRGASLARVDRADVMPYVFLYNRLARLDALRRMVIIDACQAGAILDDPAVADLRRVVERGSRKARTSYLLAARRGEPASEADALQHGLLTYTLLRGLGASGLKPIPADLGGFPGRSSADLNGDQLITSDELVSFTAETLPRLARIFPQLVSREGGNVLGTRADPAGPPALEARLKLDSSEASFPLLAAPR